MRKNQDSDRRDTCDVKEENRLGTGRRGVRRKKAAKTSYVKMPQ